MPAILRFLVVVLVGLALLLGAVAAFVLTLDAERFRGAIREQVRARAGLDLKLDGPLRFRVWPAIALEVEEVAADWTDAGADPLLEVRRAELRAALLPLLSTSPRLDVESALLDGVALDLRVDEAGRDNWSPPNAAGNPPAGVPDPAPTSDAAFALAELAMTGLSVRYADARDGTRARLEAVDAVVTDVGGSRPAEARVTGRFAVEGGPGGTLAATLRAVPARGRFDLVDLRTELFLPEAATPVVLEAEGALELPPDEDTLRIPALTLRGGALAATLEGRVDALVSDAPALDLRLAVPDGDPRPLLDALGVARAFEDPGALTRVGGELTVTGTPEALEVSPLTLRVDALRLQGRAAVHTGGARPQLDFELEAEEADLRPYLATTGEEASAEDGPLLPDDPLGLEVLERFDARGGFRADAVVLPQLAVGTTTVEMTLEAGRLDAQLRADRVYGGAVDVALALDATAEPARLVLQLDGAGLRAAEVAPTLGFVGPLALEGRIEARGETPAALARNATGGVELTGDGGSLDATPVKTPMLQVARLLDRGERIARWPDRLSYEELRGAWVLTDGLDAQRLDFRVDNLALDAVGGLDPTTGAFDFRVGAVFLETLAERAIARTFDVDPELEGIRWPLRCLGDLGDEANPCAVDQEAVGRVVADVLRTGAGAAVGEKLERELDERLPAELREPARQLLRGLFGRPAPEPQEDPATEGAPPP